MALRLLFENPLPLQDWSSPNHQKHYYYHSARAENEQRHVDRWAEKKSSLRITLPKQEGNQERHTEKHKKNRCNNKVPDIGRQLPFHPLNIIAASSQLSLLSLPWCHKRA
jgi:hypothetical protein